MRIFVRKFTGSLPKSEHRLKAQFDDNARSVIANIEEGFARPTTSEYLTFLGYSQASLIEGKGDAQRSLQDGFLFSKPGSKLKDLGIDLSDWHEALKQTVISTKPVNFSNENCEQKNFRGNYGKLKDIGKEANNNNCLLNPFKFLYPPVDNLNPKSLTYEIFIELINKTDWHLRKLVESLERKLEKDNKYYQVEKLRLRNRSS